MMRALRSQTGNMVVVIAILAAVLGPILITGVGVYSYVNNIRNTGVGHESGLTAQYLANQNYLSAYISGFYEQLGVARLKSEQLNAILLDAVRGRYDKGGFQVGSSFFTVLKEAYPDLAGLNIYDKVMDYIAAGRTGYRESQNKLLDMLRVYDAWRETDFAKSWIIRGFLSFPTERLEARVGEKVYRGAEARDKMYQIVLTPEARSAYETGTMKPLEVPGLKK